MCEGSDGLKHTQQQLGTEFLGDKASHAAAATEPASNIITSGQHTTTDGEGNILQLRAIELFDGGIEGIAINVHDALSQVTRSLKLGNELIGSSRFATEVEFVEASLLGQDLLDLLGQDLVLCLFTVEELGSFGGIVDDLGDLGLVDGILAGFR